MNGEVIHRSALWEGLRANSREIHFLFPRLVPAAPRFGLPDPRRFATALRVELSMFPVSARRADFGGRVVLLSPLRFSHFLKTRLHAGNSPGPRPVLCPIRRLFSLPSQSCAPHSASVAYETNVGYLRAARLAVVVVECLVMVAHFIVGTLVDF